jgi:hypothetical protein
MLKHQMLVHLLQLPEELQSAYNGQEITTLEDLLESLGHKLHNLILMPLLTQTFKKLFATKEEVADQIVQVIQMEETLILLMEAATLVLLQSQYLHILLTDFGLCNGHGLEEHLH